MTKETDCEVERRVNMALMAQQINEIHEEIFDKERGLCVRTKKNEEDIQKIKTIWSTVTVAAVTLWTVITHFWGRK